MDRHDKIFVNGLAAFSVLTSFGFVFYAMGILTGDVTAEWEKVFAYVAVGYGLGNVYILSAAWNTGGAWTSWANRLIAICFFAVFLMDIWQRGIKSELEVLGVLVVAGILFFNWLAAKKVAARTAGKMEEKTSSGGRGRGSKRGGRPGKSK